jgi:hypothetical protein
MAFLQWIVLTGSRLKIPANCSFDFTKFYPSIKEKEFEEMNPTHPAVSVLGLQPLRGFRCLRSEPASLYRLPQALAYRRLCPVYAGRIF